MEKTYWGKTFWKEFRTALSKEQNHGLNQEKKWILKHPVWSLMIAAFLIVVVVYGFVYSLTPPTPVQPSPEITVGGFADWFFHLQMTSTAWCILFAVLWLTKWS